MKAERGPAEGVRAERREDDPAAEAEGSRERERDGREVVALLMLGERGHQFFPSP